MAPPRRGEPAATMASPRFSSARGLTVPVWRADGADTNTRESMFMSMELSPRDQKTAAAQAALNSTLFLPCSPPSSHARTLARRTSCAASPLPQHEEQEHCKKNSSANPRQFLMRLRALHGTEASPFAWLEGLKLRLAGATTGVASRALHGLNNLKALGSDGVRLLVLQLLSKCDPGLSPSSMSPLAGMCFARINNSRGYMAPAPTIKKVEYYSVHRVKPDGRCMFRALVQGMATNKGMSLSDDEETAEADELRLAVADALCHGEKRRMVYEEALIAITIEESLKRYCQRILRSDFWGGESELLVLSRMCSQPITVYIPESKVRCRMRTDTTDHAELHYLSAFDVRSVLWTLDSRPSHPSLALLCCPRARRDGARWGSGYVPIAEYGTEFTKATKTRKARKTVRLLYNGINHYDLLL